MRVEGQEGAAAIVAKDLVRDIDDSFKTIFDKSFTAAERVKKYRCYIRTNGWFN